MEDQLGYEESERSESDAYWNSYKEKTVKLSLWLNADRSASGKRVHIRPEGSKETAKGHL